MAEWTSPKKIEVDGIELSITQTKVKQNVYVKVHRKVGRDRQRRLDITAGIETQIEDALSLVDVLRRVAKFQTSRCTCDYRVGFSDHAEHCQSIYVANSDGGCHDDD
jgi:hypothetical protein